MTAVKTAHSGRFDTSFREEFEELVLWRRDVRRFRRNPVPQDLVRSLLNLASHAPSVGHSQPWRFVFLESEAARETIRSSFARANKSALEGYVGQTRERYARLKLAGIDAAPIQLAVFADESTDAGSGLGRQTMPEALRYSVVGALQIFWLAARAHGLGVGWVSILEPEIIKCALGVPNGWTFIAHLCVGWPEEEHTDPELVRHGWQPRLGEDEIFFRR
ncbi:5,6-dimethylbenzimidazole synthase [Hyphomicrobium sp. MC1]|uniref:5,6-dimethylbenzimidazole synthase n=1 Tax=Hyphomicrobium sp. (strain MC1) TaxID=717785 RepID=UPI000213F1EB|nr:5,6-dimethylbenzimidazole synthase [Hyphomicrobium sp. MC1]CCB65508.1 Putative cob(II)yrinic acid a,c-diamide reductase [Hyphomicrobium sp. MC1]